MRFNWVNLLTAHSGASRGKKAVILKSVQKTEQRLEWVTGDHSTGAEN
jgi:hypothetical protein